MGLKSDLSGLEWEAAFPAFQTDLPCFSVSRPHPTCPPLGMEIGEGRAAFHQIQKKLGQLMKPEILELPFVYLMN